MAGCTIVWLLVLGILGFLFVLRVRSDLFSIRYRPTFVGVGAAPEALPPRPPAQTWAGGTEFRRKTIGPVVFFFSPLSDKIGSKRFIFNSRRLLTETRTWDWKKKANALTASRAPVMFVKSRTQGDRVSHDIRHRGGGGEVGGGGGWNVKY